MNRAKDIVIDVLGDAIENCVHVGDREKEQTVRGFAACLIGYKLSDRSGVTEEDLWWKEGWKAAAYHKCNDEN